MTLAYRTSRTLSLAAGCLGLGIVAASTGCQVDVGGQTLPSPYYLYDDVQYFPAGPEFKLSREAAALEAAQESEARRRPRRSRAGRLIDEVAPGNALPVPEGRNSAVPESLEPPADDAALGEELEGELPEGDADADLPADAEEEAPMDLDAEE